MSGRPAVGYPHIRAVAAHLSASLVEVARRRPDRPEQVVDPVFGSVPEFVVAEARALLAEVNAYRTGGGLAPVGLDALARAESSAVGHVDYLHKYTWRCAELALGAE